MKKKLDVTDFAHELADSVFFPPKPAEVNIRPKEEPNLVQKQPSVTPPVHKPNLSRARDVASTDASMIASKRASTIASEEDLEHVRKILKRLGKEVLYVRLTPEEKTEVSDIEYTYEHQGIKTSGNEVGRIALNFLLRDYKANGEQSILAKVLAALHT